MGKLKQAVRSCCDGMVEPTGEVQCSGPEAAGAQASCVQAGGGRPSGAGSPRCPFLPLLVLVPGLKRRGAW